MTSFDTQTTPFQLVLDGPEESPHVSLVENPYGKPPLSFDSKDRWVPLLGTAAVLKLASAMSAHGSRVTRFELRTLGLEPLPEESEKEISAKLVDAMANGAASAEKMLGSEFKDVLVIGVEVMLDARRATVARQGVVRTKNRDKLVALLQMVWRETVIG